MAFRWENKVETRKKRKKDLYNWGGKTLRE